MILHLSTLLASGPTTTAAATHKSGGLSLDPIAKPIAGLLAYIYGIIPNYGVAILILSVLWMVLISPLTLKSTRSMLAMQKLQPQLKKLQEQHKNDRQAFAQAQMDLFREHQVSPFGSCIPMLLPMPIFFALFKVINGLSRTVRVGGNAVADPKYLSHNTRMFRDIVSAHGHLNAFGMDLSHNALSAHSSFLAAIPFWLLLLVMAGTSYLQTVQTMSRNPAAQQNPQMRMMKFIPIIFVIFCVRFPAGVILYYSMSNVCRIVQQDLMYRFDPKVKALVAQEVQEVEAMTHDIDEREEKRRQSPGYTPPRSALTGKDAGPKKPAPPSGGGRMKFRELLAAAAEQQQQQKAKAAANGQARNAQPGNQKPAASKSGNGAAAAGGQRSGGSRQAGSKKNRKRRGR